MMKNKLKKALIVVNFALFALSAVAQTTLTVDAGSVLNDVSRKPVGMNMNYLMDDSYLGTTTQLATTEALRKMGTKFLRFPGGEKSDNYLWSSAPWTAPNPRFARTGSCEWPSGDSRFAQTDYKTPKPSCLDFDEFISMCKSIGAEPVIVVAYDCMYKPVPAGCTGTIPTRAELLANAEEWVRYANIKKGYNIKYWMIGNESYNTSAVNGYVTGSQYGNDLVEFSSRMKAVDPKIKIIANGEGDTWWSKVLPVASSSIDFIGISNYPIWNYSSGYENYRSSTPDLSAPVVAALKSTYKYAAIADKDRIKAMVTEFNSMDWAGSWANANDVGHSLVSFEMLGQFLQNPKIESSMFWNTRWVNNATKMNDLYDAMDKNSNLEPSGAALSLWGSYLKDKMVATTSTASVRTFASYSESTREMTIFIINKEGSSQSANLDIKNYLSTYTYSKKEFAGTSPSDQAPVIRQLESGNGSGTTLKVSLSPYSVTVISLKPTGGTVLSTAEKGKIGEDFAIFPNPAKEKIFVTFPSQTQEDIKVKVFSVDGKEVFVDSFDPTSGKKEINSSQWARGLYIVRMEAGKTEFIRKVIVQ